MSRPRTNRPLLRVESLDRRDLPAVTAFASGGVLYVTGDAAGNHVVVHRNGPSVHVTDRGILVKAVNPSRVSKIWFPGGDGHDALHGNTGSDSLFGADGNHDRNGGNADGVRDDPDGTAGRDTDIQELSWSGSRGYHREHFLGFAAGTDWVG
jgi:hypothetical protein